MLVLNSFDFSDLRKGFPMPITFPIVAPSTSPTLASLTSGGLSGLTTAILLANSLPSTLTTAIRCQITAGQAVADAHTAITNFVTGQPIDLFAADDALAKSQATFSTLALAISQARIVIAANRGTLTLNDGGTITHPGANSRLYRTWT